MEIFSKEEDGVLVTEFPQATLWPREHPGGLEVSVTEQLQQCSKFPSGWRVLALSQALENIEQQTKASSAYGANWKIKLPNVPFPKGLWQSLVVSGYFPPGPA